MLCLKAPSLAQIGEFLLCPWNSDRSFCKTKQAPYYKKAADKAQKPFA